VNRGRVTSRKRDAGTDRYKGRVQVATGVGAWVRGERGPYLWRLQWALEFERGF